jgi:hypothetical protein
VVSDGVEACNWLINRVRKGYAWNTIVGVELDPVQKPQLEGFCGVLKSVVFLIYCVILLF